MPGPQLQHAAPGAPRVGARLRRRLPPAIKNTTNAKRKRSLRCNGSPPRLKATFRKVPCQIQGALRAEFPIALSVGANAKNQASQSSPPEAWSTESGCNSWQKGGQSTTRQATFKTSNISSLCRISLGTEQVSGQATDYSSLRCTPRTQARAGLLRISFNALTAETNYNSLRFIPGTQRAQDCCKYHCPVAFS